MKKHILSTVISSLLFGATASYAENLQFQFRIPLKTQLSNWTGVEPVYHPWVNIGSHYDCADWSPLADTIDFGKDFTQSRDCKQNQERNIEIRELDSFSGTVKTVRNEQENRSVTEIESQSAIGTYQNWVSHDSTFTDWADKDAAHSFSTWTPDPIAQTANFIQSRNYKQPQVRHEQHREIDTVTGDVKNIGEPILRTQDDIRSENRSVTVNWTAWEDTKRDGFGDWLPVEYTETADFKQSRVYGQHQIRDRIYGTSGDELKRIGESRVVSPLYEDRSVSVTASNWVDTTRIDYSNWTPAATTQIAGFSQSRTYTQNQERTWSYKSGGEELKARLETRAVSNKSETQSVLVTWSAWVNKGAHYDCGDWSPATNTIGHGEDFAQTRTCKQDQTRNRIYSVAGTAINTVAEAQTINETESQAATGVGSWASTTSTFTTWVNSGAPYEYGAWSPASGAQTANYTQTRSYKQNQTRTEQKREIDTIGGTIRNVGTPVSQSQTITPSENQSVVVTASNWANTTASGHTAWSPAATTQTANFTQTRSFTQAQSRTWTHKVGTSTVHSRTETQNLTGQTESQTVSVTWSAWANSGLHHTCGAWTPATNTIASGVAYTQTRTCKQDQTRNRIYSVGSTTINTVAEAQTINETESQAATGVGNWESTTSVFTEWVNSGTRYDLTAWLPSYGDQTSDYVRTRTFKQNQTRTEQKREVDTIGGTIRNVGTPLTENKTITGSNQHTITVTAGEWGTLSVSDHSAWTPEASTQPANTQFTQTRTYTEGLARTWSHRLAGDTNVLHSREERKTITGQTESRTVSVSQTAWTNSGAHFGCGEWTPAGNTIAWGVAYTQTRTCKQDQTRNRIYSVGSTTINTVSEAQTINETESQAATGLGNWQPTASMFTAWVNSGTAYDHDAWSPVSGTQTTNYTQTRSYKQEQTRTEQKREIDTAGRISRFVGSPIPQSQTITLSESQTVIVTASNWANTTASGHTAWSPAATTQTANFTQTRIFTQAQSRTWTHKVGTATVHSRAETQNLTGQTESQTVSVTYSAWANSGVHHTCGEWTPAGNTIASGVAYTQTRTCKQDQTRNRIYSVGSTTINTVSEAQTINEIESQAATGLGNWQPTTSMFTAWVNSGAAYEHGSWSPVSGAQTSNYTQTRTYKQNQTRTEQKREIDTIGGTIRNVGTPVSQSQTITPSESQSVVVTASNWTNTTASGHTAWSPAATTQTASFTQTRSYTQAQARTWTHKVGTATVHSRAETQSLNAQAESRTVTVGWTNWANSGAAYNCGAWSPATDTINWGQAFTQTRNCSQLQNRNRNYSSGETAQESQVISVTQSQESSGTKDSIVSQTYGTWSAWTNSGDVYGCSSWSPEPSTVCSGSTFTQARSCSQNQTRNRSVTSVWASGATSSAGTESGVQTISAGQNQSSSGTKNCWAPAASELTAWSTYSTDYSTWSPAATTQSSNFNQTREVTAYQEQYEQKREYHSGTGTYRNVGTPVRTTRAVSGGTESRTVTVTNSGWLNSGAAYNCGGYSPDPSTVSSGQVYTQYGSCSQNQIAYFTYSVGGTYQFGSQTVSVGDSRSAIGTKPINGTWQLSNDTTGFILRKAVFTAIDNSIPSSNIQDKPCSPIGSNATTDFFTTGGPYGLDWGQIDYHTAFWTCR